MNKSESDNREKAILKLSSDINPLFGEMSMFNDGDRRTANVRAETVCILVKLDKLDLFIKNTALEKRSLAIQEQVEDKSLEDRLSSLEEKLVTKRVGGRIINAKKPMEVFDADKLDKPAEPFEIDEITKVVSEKENQPDTKNSQPEKENKSVKVHEDDEDTSRIGREGDLLKRKKI